MRMLSRGFKLDVQRMPVLVLHAGRACRPAVYKQMMKLAGRVQAEGGKVESHIWYATKHGRPDLLDVIMYGSFKMELP